jgi:hypothetical protein
MAAEKSARLGIADVIGAKREAVLELATAHKAYNVRVFGSVARGTAGQDSDVDFLVSMQDDASIFDQIGLWQALQALLGRRVSLVSDRALDDHFRTRIASEIWPL